MSETCNCCQQQFDSHEAYVGHFQDSRTTLPILQLVREFHLVPKAEFNVAHVEHAARGEEIVTTYISFTRRI